jgi:hypothetical protein
MNQYHAISRNGTLVRLTDERWQHIIEEHPELVGLCDELVKAVNAADRVLAGSQGELLAVRLLDAAKAMIVVYRETSPDDGFVITAFVTGRLKSLERRVQLWPPQT